MSPWANYTFRVIAWNKIGPSAPSAHSDVCTTQPEVPHKNPDNVEGEGDQPNNLVIRWTVSIKTINKKCQINSFELLQPMPEIEHNGPRFQYRVYWRRDIPGEKEGIEDITNWRTSSFVIRDQPPFQQYRIKVIAMNENGEANVSPKEVIGYSGEDKPLEAPSNFTLLQVQSPTTALLSWNPVRLDSVRGHFKGYKIKTWTDDNVVDYREIQVQGDATKALVTNFVPNTKNYAMVYVYNGRYDGPPSEILSFDTPEGVPEEISRLEAIEMGSSAFLLIWDKPEKPNGKLTGYRIYYAVVNGTTVGQEIPRHPQIDDPNRLRAKLGGLEPGVKYRVLISATTAAGESKKYINVLLNKSDILIHIFAGTTSNQPQRRTVLPYVLVFPHLLWKGWAKVDKASKETLSKYE